MERAAGLLPNFKDNKACVSHIQYKEQCNMQAVLCCSPFTDEMSISDKTCCTIRTMTAIFARLQQLPFLAKAKSCPKTTPLSLKDVNGFENILLTIKRADGLFFPPRYILI